MTQGIFITDDIHNIIHSKTGERASKLAKASNRVLREVSLDPTSENSKAFVKKQGHHRATRETTLLQVPVRLLPVIKVVCFELVGYSIVPVGPL
jgi:hypothetical protein